MHSTPYESVGPVRYFFARADFLPFFPAGSDPGLAAGFLSVIATELMQ